MRRDIEDYKVGTSHVKLRTVAFIVAIVVAIAAFGFGFSRMGQKGPGYYIVEAAAVDEAPRYRNGITLVMYHPGGSAADSRAALDEVKGIYKNALLWSYKLLDTENTYEGFVNLATLNQGLGQEFQVHADLQSVLEDAWAKTLEGKSVNLFGGALYDEWNSILSLDDISEFDPALNPEQAARITMLAEETAKVEYFSFSTSDGKVKVTVSEEYLEFLREHEFSANLLTLGPMKDAYRLAMIKKALEDRGYTNGYLTTDSGLSLSLSEYTGGEFVLYGNGDKGVQRWAGVKAGENAVCSYLHTFPMQEGEVMYHMISDEAGTRRYHPNFLLADGGFAEVLESSCVVRYDGDIVETCYANLNLYQLTDRAAVKAEKALIACTFMGETGKTVYSNAPELVSGENGAVVKPFS